MLSPVPFLSKLFIGFPGLLLWIAGGIATGLLGFTIFPHGSPPNLQGFVQLGIAIAAAILGYLMVTADGLLSGTSRHQIPGEHVPKLIAMELGIQISAMLGVCLGLAALGQMGGGHTATILVLFLIALLCFATTSRLSQRLEAAVNRWESEQLNLQEAPPTPDE